MANLPPKTTGPQLQTFLEGAIEKLKIGSKFAPGSSGMGIMPAANGPIKECWLSDTGEMAYLELRTTEDAQAVVSLNEIVMNHFQLFIGLPTVALPTAAIPAALSLTGDGTETAADGAPKGLAAAAAAAANLNANFPAASSAAGATAAASEAAKGPVSNVLMCMNLPKYIDEPQVLRLLAPFGDTKAFNMHKDEKGKSKGTIVFEYDDPEITTGALSSLNGLMLGEIRLLFQRVPPEMAATLLRSTDQAKKMDEAEQAAKKVCRWGCIGGAA